MPPRKRRTKAPRPAQVIPVEGRSESPLPYSPPPDQEEVTAPADPVTTNETEEAEEDACARKRAAPRVVTNFTEEEKEIIIDFLQQNPTLYSKRLAGYKDAAAKDRLWAEQARQMKRTPNELKTWYDSMRTKLGKLKKAATKSGQAADGFTATERWIWQHFQFLSEHITQMPRRTVASFNARLQPSSSATSSTYLPAPDPQEETPLAPEAPEDAPSAGTTDSTHTSSTASANSGALIGLLETFLTQRQNKAHPSTAFGCYVDGSLRNLPPAIRRKAEARILGTLHECHNEAERQQLWPVDSQHTGPAGQRHLAACGEPPAQRPTGRPREPSVRQWQPPPSQWPSEVTNSPDLWHSMDRPWVQQQFPEMNIICPPPITGNQQQPQRSSSTQSLSTSAVEGQDMSYSQMLNSDSYLVLGGSDPEQHDKSQQREKDQ